MQKRRIHHYQSLECPC